MSRCKDCGSWAINPDMHGRTPGADLKLCDVCYWRTRANALESQIAAHEKVCAGVLVPVTERLPALKILDDAPVKNPIGLGLLPGLARSGKIVCMSEAALYLDELIASVGCEDKPVWNFGRSRKYTHWLDAKEPQR